MEEDGKDINLLNASSHVQQQQQHTILIQVLELGFSCRQSDRQNADDDDDDGCDDDDDNEELSQKAKIVDLPIYSRLPERPPFL